METLVWKKHMDSSYSFLEDPPPPVQRVGIPDWEGELGPDGYPGMLMHFSANFVLFFKEKI